ncbi:MAG: PTS sugar transporter subunit IIA [Hafnia alvei]|uniref:PTS sugar transporter subunit IIA n=1 Tax=Hafniaceae TaxID=1903412 RepID=UPI0010330F30|nr:MULTISPECIES: PTS fructose transporter subunit IIA [Hafniaceae]MDN6018381.1 PTS fructose transporter subunit IIA [Enterobacterales bacterium]MDN6111432.1 PTS fructose transporter subunit IIA [Enterobacterales bacterium]MDN6113944.1 PTS fructose transporter subunit IIA [Enterobacterales bacterium]TBL37917.1 PTS fructose transporter subunit IIA [Hafnia alvei]TBL75885.1 PTS fructose transporter subunit IIA [Obesumbacterium proteus]
MSTTASHSLPQILLLTHGGWGSQLCASLRMVTGDIQGVAEIALMPVDTFSEFFQRVEQAVIAMPKGSLILTDFIGGTTSNVAARLSVDYPIGVICGLNASLLLQALELRETGLLTDAIEELVEAGRDSCLDVVAHINSLQNNA